jgi:hypothetical protein
MVVEYMKEYIVELSLFGILIIFVSVVFTHVYWPIDVKIVDDRVFFDSKKVMYIPCTQEQKGEGYNSVDDDADVEICVCMGEFCFWNKFQLEE